MEKLALDVLADLGGNAGAIPGARLADQIARRARAKSVDFHAWLREQGLSFKAFVRRAGIRVTDFQGSDILVSLSTAEVPTSPTPHSFARSEQIRKDVYDAFTRIEPEGYAYLTDTSRFVPTKELDARPSIPVPPLTLSDLLQVRNDFVSSIPAGDSATAEQLRMALSSANPLRRFTATLYSTNRLDAWRKFLYEHLQENITSWATKQGVTIREDWFRNNSANRGDGTIDGSKLPNLRRWLTTLGDEELGEIMIPARLVERALKR